MRRHKTKAIVLKRIDYGEADRIITVLAPEGKLSLLARGARRVRSKLASGIELLAENELSYIEGRGELMTLISSRPISQWNQLLADYERLQLAYKILEHVQRMTERRAGQEFYEVLRISLSGLDRTKQPELVGVWFLLQALAISGHQPNLSTDEKGASLEADKLYQLIPGHGVLREVSGGKLGAGHIKLWRLALTNPLEIVLGIRGASKLASESRPILERFARYQYR